jgi:hypothetical protein
MKYQDSLVPHLSRTMPEVAGALPWLLLADALMVGLSLLAMTLLLHQSVRLDKRTAEQWRDTGLVTTAQNAVNVMTRARGILVILSAVLVAGWGVAYLATNLGSEWNELVFSVLLASVMLPAYLALSFLGRGIDNFIRSIRTTLN